MNRPTNRENLRSLADQIVWGIENYIKTGIDDIKGLNWDTDCTLETLGLNNAHNTKIFPSTTGRTCTLTAHDYLDIWGEWTELSDDIENTLTSLFANDDGYISAIVVEYIQSANETWMIELGYGEAKTCIALVRFISGYAGTLPIPQRIPIRSFCVSAGETIYGRLMSSKAIGEIVKIHIRYYLCS